MAKTFEDIVTNVSNEIKDTDAEMKSILGVYVNSRYRQILRSTSWEIINDTYTISVTSGTDTYTLPSDFGKEVYVVDSGGNELERTTFTKLANDNADTLITAGALENYIIFRDEANAKKIKLFHTPSVDTTLSIPYKLFISADLTSTDEPVNQFADLIEIGVKADAWRYKRQFSKAQVFEYMFDTELDRYMWDEENNDNDPHQFSADQEQYDRNIIG